MLFDGMEGTARMRFVFSLGGAFLPITRLFSSSTREEIKSDRAVVFVILVIRFRSIPTPPTRGLKDRSVSV